LQFDLRLLELAHAPPRSSPAPALPFAVAAAIDLDPLWMSIGFVEKGLSVRMFEWKLLE
jgi:hypothetical protein